MRWAALVLGAALSATAASDTRRSGFDDMSPAIQALQRDDGQNPAMLWVQGGTELWSTKVGKSNKSCADCHGDAVVTMKGVAARYPRFDVRSGRAVDLGERIRTCRERHQQTTPLAPESDDLLSLSSYVSLQSRGLPIAPDADPRLDASAERGRRLFDAPLGQLDLACAQCHAQHAGAKLGGSTIPEAHPTGYPLYRLDWQTIGSLQRRLRACMTGVRAEPFPFAAQEWVDLEVFLKRRAAGMRVDAPAVRP